MFSRLDAISACEREGQTPHEGRGRIASRGKNASTFATFMLKTE